ncbi:hypothetical protein J437_LFUL012185 [Ladona fulva]|uniref:Uncharacterized protein n=1 Tax=Ladona fulva TaxID=123851 RepID=A0A8K0NZ03_LADFU|nr:hypothetical protein J437_LFUL012185 [Ladona fulva]
MDFNRKRFKYTFGSLTKGKVLVILFPHQDNHSYNSTLDTRREEIQSSFQKIGYEPLEWEGHALNNTKRTVFLKDLEKVAGELLPSESFVMIINCFQKEGELRMTSGDTFQMDETHPFDGTSSGVHQSKGTKKATSNPVILPNDSDMLIIYSFEGNMNKPASTSMVSQSPSFMCALTEVLEDDFKKDCGHESIGGLMVMVSNKVNHQIGQDKPIVLTTLRNRYYLKVLTNMKGCNLTLYKNINIITLINLNMIYNPRNKRKFCLLRYCYTSESSQYTLRFIQKDYIAIYQCHRWGGIYPLDLYYPGKSSMQSVSITSLCNISLQALDINAIHSSLKCYHASFIQCCDGNCQLRPFTAVTVAS